MKIWTRLSLLCLIGMVSGCSNTRFLTEDQVLYTGRRKVEIKQEDTGKNNPPVKNYVESITLHKVNNAVFNRRVLPPIGLWVHNHMKPEKDKKFKSWAFGTGAAAAAGLIKELIDNNSNSGKSTGEDFGYTLLGGAVGASIVFPLKSKKKKDWRRINGKSLVELTFYATEFTIDFEVEGNIDLSAEVGEKITHDVETKINWTTNTSLKIATNDKIPFGFFCLFFGTCVLVFENVSIESVFKNVDMIQRLFLLFH